MMSSMLDRGDSYKVKYLGTAMLSQMATGLGLLQRPLRDMYFQFRQASARAPVKLQERHLMMTDNGMVVSYHNSHVSSPKGGATSDPANSSVEELFTMPSILFWDAVQFVTVKGPDKKLRAAFEPLDNDHSRNKDNLFSLLDKSQYYLHGKSHPPLFTCVLRRTQGVKALDVHAFLCYSDDEAVGLVRALNTVHSSYSTDEQQETGVFGYNPFGKDSVRSTAGIERNILQQQLQQARRAGDREDAGHRTEHEPPQHQFIVRKPGGDAPQSRSVTSSGSSSLASSHSVRERKAPLKSPARDTPPSDVTRFTASQPNLSALSLAGSTPGHVSTPAARQSKGQQQAAASGARDRNSRVFMLSQTDFAADSKPSVFSSDAPPPYQQEQRKEKQKVKHEKQEKQKKQEPVKATYDYIQHIDRTLDRSKDRNTAESPAVFSSSSAKKDEPSTNYGSITRSIDIGDDTLHKPIAFAGGGIFQEDKRFAKKTDSNQKMGQGYSLMSSSHGVLPGYAPHQRSKQPYAPSPIDQDRSPSPSYQHTIDRHKGESTRPGQTYENLPREGEPPKPLREQLLGHSGPDAYPIPLIPPRSPMLQTSGSFRREAHVTPERRPPTTTQGTVMAQVTPQSQRGSQIGPFANRSGPVLDKASSKTTDNPNSARSNISQISGHSKPIAKVPPHKIQGVKVLPSKPNVSSLKSPSNPLMSQKSVDGQVLMRSQSPDLERKNRPNSVFMDNETAGSPLRKAKSQYFPTSKAFSSPTSPPTTDVYAMPKKSSQKAKSKHETSAKQEACNWQFNKTGAPNSAKKQLPPGSPENKAGKTLLQSQKKDAEISSLMQNIDFDYEGTMSPHAAHRTNFEKSLGYFP